MKLGKYNRRQVLSTIAAGTGLATLSSPISSSRNLADDVGDMTVSFTEDGIKQAFTFEPGFIALNAANLCPASKPVMAAQLNYMDSVNKDPSFENRLRFDALKETVRGKLAAMVGASVNEIAITRNTSEGNCTIINGLTIGRGDEVVLWDQNHESNSLSWQEASRRHGFTIKMVTTPTNPISAEDLLMPFKEAMNNNTKIVSFSHVSNMTGVRLPVEQLCALAREKGVYSLVDGAQTFAAMPINLHEMGCDFYTASTHKWFAGPRECGLLYVRQDVVGDVWPAIVTHGWHDDRGHTARKLDCLGQQEDGRLMAIEAAIDFHYAIGSHKIYDRIMALNTHLRAGLKNTVPSSVFLTPLNTELSAGITVFTLPEPDAERIRRALYDKYNVSALCIPMNGQSLLRFCPHIYNSYDELDTVVNGLVDTL